ncbi:MAG: phage tail family protein [Oscillospiraceae bacterium]|nr:phage tail family protein [Oscillospiraceae bacterium]
MNVTINSEPLTLSDYMATYLNHKYIPSALDIKNFWADKSLTPLYFDTERKYDELEIQVMFKDAAFTDISAFSEKLKRCEIQIDHAFTADRIFDCILKNTELEKVSQKIYTVTYTFDCFVFGKTHEITVGDSIFIHSSKETEAVITIENTTASVISVAGITGFTVKNLAAGEIIVIDGIKKIVTANGVHAFDRVEFFSFPRFKPGNNDIRVTGNAEITIMYRERW